MIYAKEKMLKALKEKGLNTFDYKILHTDADLIEYHRFHKNFTIRFTKEEDCQDLPFYIIDENVPSEKLIRVAMEAYFLKCAMLVSDGVVYEGNQVLNFVFCKQTDGRFILEYRIGKEPLRHMYNYDTTVIIGNIFSGKEDWENFSGHDRDSIGFTDLEYILNFILSTDIYNKYVECTLYDVPVGINKERVIVWGY